MARIPSIISRVVLTIAVTAVVVHAGLLLVAARKSRAVDRPVQQVRLLDHVANAVRLDTPATRAADRMRLGPPTRRADLASFSEPNVRVTHDLIRGFEWIEPLESSELHIRWSFPMGSEALDVRLDVGVRLGRAPWRSVVEGGAFTLRFTGGPFATPSRVAPTVRNAVGGVRRHPAFDPAEAWCVAVAKLGRAGRLADSVSLLAADADHITWASRTVRVEAMPGEKPGARFATVCLDVRGVKGPIAIRLTTTTGTSMPPPPKATRSYRYADAPGLIGHVKRVVVDDREDRVSLVLGSPSTIAFDVRVPADPELTFGLRSLAPPDESAEPARVRIDVVNTRGRRALFETTVDSGLRAWSDHRIACPGLAGVDARLEFRQLEGPAVAISNPVLQTRGRVKTTPSVVLVTVDSLRDDAVGPDTPALLAFAAGGVRVSDAVAGGLNTYTSVPGMMTATPVLGAAAGSFAEQPPPDLDTLADVLRRHGCTARAFIPDYYMNSFEKGFVERPREPDGSTQPDWDRVARALGFLEARAATHREPVFLWLHLDGPHAPWLPVGDDAPEWAVPGHPDPGDPRARWQRAATCLIGDDEGARRGALNYLAHAYRAQVRRSDAVFAEFLAGLDRLGLAENTLVVVHADHGVGVERNAGSRDFSDQTLHVPLLFRWPNRLPRGETRGDGVMGLVDVAPTVCALLGIDRPAGWWGRDRSGWLRGTTDATVESGRLFGPGWACLRHLRTCAIVTRDWRLVLDLADDGRTVASEQLDARRDTDGDEAAIAAELRTRLLETATRVGNRFSTGELSDAVKRFLREAGYLESEDPTR